MKTMKRIAGVAAALAVSATVAAAGTTLKLAHAAPESDLQQTMSLFFKEQVEARTNGEVKVNIFPSGQLGNDAQMIDGTRSGIIDISMVGLNNYSGLMPESAAFTLPFMFPTRDTAYKVLDGEVGQGVLDDMGAHGLKGLGFPENGYRNMTNNRGPIKTPADVQGLQMRVNNSKALNDMFNALKANPQQIPVAELYTALETGVVDAQDHPIGVTLSFKFFEVQKYLSMTRHAYSPLAVAMNLKKFEGLSADEQAVILEVAQEAVNLQRELSIEKEDSMIAELESAGMTVNQDVDGAAFQAAITPVWDSFISQNGDTLVNAILAASK
ncbi:TRAP transporter substrate-binding protein [Cognatishimia activa]|uniref:Extracytoplasmic solute receptor protein YiaO n=1 Tax=Cognatishimia activa TaxID=1715691 RepID=A0A0P1IT32_9RHOB|nr:DctP family TRAP transporter solute-binding subunit [Cognatishimia activa]CUI72953.1 Extracytoplasmic solute receptor protein YiaO [Cognatishimia activa]CUK26636.1 Extracytoplasmic solute receptor protein YiaO [Cognatishimia activa]